ncbi:MAG TPA: CDP-alcohol phosphatidyltransferase family protein [Gaiellales bacterium]|jgi:CDP-diacylglycerol--glycerol-3-phosphate 3-phosphatidyltransferase|nr:CDP-alcohol phosphatidyltransferase family protein [Gaiellales bacterium]
MSAMLARLKAGYTSGGRGVGMAVMGRFSSIPVTPNQITVAGLTANGVAAVLIYREHFVWATVAFVAGSILDIADGALARSHGKLTPFGGFLDSTTDRISEGLILGSIALVFARQGHTWALACVFVALVGSFLVSYTRAKAEAIGLRCEVGLMSRAERIVLVAVALPFAGLGSLTWAIYLLAGLTAFTVWQRIDYVRRQLAARKTPEV